MDHRHESTDEEEQETEHKVTRRSPQKFFISIAEEETDDYSAGGINTNIVFDVIVPVFTCFRQNKTLNVRPIQQYAEWLCSQNVQTVFINGVIGEGPLMTLKERRANCEYWVKATKELNMLVMVHVGGASLPDVIALAAHAEFVGVAAVSTLPDLFYRPRSVDELVQYCKIIAKSCPKTPFFYYHIPLLTAVDLDMPEFCLKAEDSIPNFRGIHYGSSDLEMAQKCLRPGRTIYLLSSTLVSGALVGGIYNFNVALVNVRPELLRSLLNAFIANDLLMVRDLQREISHLAEVHEVARDFNANWVIQMKKWFNREKGLRKPYNFSAGVARYQFN